MKPVQKLSDNNDFKTFINNVSGGSPKPFESAIGTKDAKGGTGHGIMDQATKSMKTMKTKKSFREQMSVFLSNFPNVSGKSFDKQMEFYDDTQLKEMTIEEIKELGFINTMTSFNEPWFISMDDENEIEIHYVSDIYEHANIEERTEAFTSVINSTIHQHILSLGYTTNVTEILTEYITNVGGVFVNYVKQ